MSDLENARARREALSSTPVRRSSADRARFWAGLNRYLAAEAHIARSKAGQDRDETEQEKPATPEPE